MSKRTSLMSTVVAAIVTTALAGATLVWAAGAGTGSTPPKTRSTEVATLDTHDMQARAEELRQRLAETRERVGQLHGTHVKTPSPKPPKPRPQPRPQPQPQPPHTPFTIDPACLANPICSKAN